MRNILLVLCVMFMVGCTTFSSKSPYYRSVDVTDGVSEDSIVQAVLHMIELHYLDSGSANRLTIYKPAIKNNSTLACFTVFANNAAGGSSAGQYNRVSINNATGEVVLAYLGGAACGSNPKLITEVFYRKKDDIFNYPGYKSVWDQ